MNSFQSDADEMPIPWDLRGKVIIVTGASSGIGQATARELFAAGAIPVLAARRVARLTALGRELGGALALPTDVTDPLAVGRLVNATLERFGRIDGLVNNAGRSLRGAIDEVDLAEFTRVLALNVVSVVALTQAVLPTMRAQGDGRIVNLSSGTTRMVLPHAGPYAATKSAVNMLSAVSRAELAADGIVVSLVLPSITATEFGSAEGLPTLEAGQPLWQGMVAHNPGYVAKIVLRALRSGEEAIDIPHGPERADMIKFP